MILLPALIASGCSHDKGDCLKSTGEVLLEERTAPVFTAIEVFNNINVIITRGSACAVTVEAGKNLQDKIATEVVDGVLMLKNGNKCNWVRSYKYEITVHVTAVDLSEITHRGYGLIRSGNTISGDQLLIESDGNGNIDLEIAVNYCYANMHVVGDLRLSGTASALGLWMSGNGWTRCMDLEADKVFLDSYSSGDCFVFARKELTANLYGVGNVHYTGFPATLKLIDEGAGDFLAE